MSVSDQPRTLLTVRQVAERLGQAEVTVRRKIASGALPALRLGPGRGAVRVDEDELNAWLYSTEHV